jgi:TonB-linked SusC/RagA family outer membrane protein
MANVFCFFGSRKRFLYFILFLFSLGSNVLSVSAQDIAIQGKVIDERNNESIIGASVVVDGTTTGVVTNVSGEFNLNVAALPATIVVSYIGYRTEEIEIYEKPSDRITVPLTEDVNALNEVVVVGYTTTKRGSLTSAVSVISVANLANTVSPTLAGKLQGEIPGLLISSNSGVPGSSSLIRLRGATSITANNNPIYIVDGTFVSTADLQQQDLGGQKIDPLADLNPDDIETITVLKDASATAAYGARGANGVILITTKRGSRNAKTKVYFGAEFGAAKSENLWNLVSGPEHAEIVNEMYKNNGNWAGRPFQEGSAFLGTPESQKTYERVSDIFRTGKSQRYNLSVTGGNEKTNFYFGGEYNNQESTLKMQDFKRYSFRLNLDHNISAKLKIGTSNTLANTERELVRVGDGPAGLFQAALHTPTFYPIFKDDGTYNKPAAFDNHQAIIDHNDGHSYGLRSINNVYARWEIIDGLSFKTSYNNDRNIYHEKFYYDTSLKDGSGVNGLAYDRTSWSNVFGTEQLLNFLKTFGVHTVSAYLGASYQKTTRESSSITGTNFPADAFKRIASAASQTATSTGTSSALLSYFGGVNYSYENRYSLDFTLRADGSSRVSADNRWGYFPAVGASWNITNEKFIPKNEYLTDLRLKASWGLAGNESVGDFASLGLWQAGYDYDGASGLAPYQLSNPALKWETTRQWNIGLNFSLIKNRINVDFNYYDKYTYDLLLEEPLPSKTGFTSITKNSGEVSNKGLELAINSVNVKTKKFTWRTDFTISHNKNILKKLPVEVTGGYPMYKLIEGHPLYSFWVWNYQGVDPQTGDAIYEDVVPEGKQTVEDKIIAGDAWPDFEGILKNTLTYKNWSFDFSFYYKYGNELFNYTRRFLETGGTYGYGRSMQASSTNYWKAPGDVDVLPRPKSTANADGSLNYEYQSSRMVEDGSFIRLRNVTLAYTIPTRLTSKLGISRANLYLTGSNLLLFSKYTGPDPEVSLDRDTYGLVQGLDFGTPPQPRSIVGGINITF